MTAALSVLLVLVLGACAGEPPRRIGVVYLVHGGFDEYSPEAGWNATMQIFGYDPHSTVYQRVIWNANAWPMLLRFGNAPKERGKYAFEYERLGGPDPAGTLTQLRYRQLRENLEARQDALGGEFVVDHASWITEDPAHHVYPRALYRPGVEGGSELTYCGSGADGGVGPDAQWDGCDPQRYDTDGTVERLLKAGVDEIVFIDMTTSGVRFFKSFDAVNLARQVVADHNRDTGGDVGVYWVNDPTDLMTESYPTAPARWTRSLGAPETDRRVPLDGRPNPVSSDPRLAQFHVNGIEPHLRADVAAAKTGVVLINHATRRGNQAFDPKIDDTLVLNANIKAELLARHPGLDSGNIVGAWMGVKEMNPSLERFERTRAMRGENLGEAWLYETEQPLPGGAWRFRYWEALAYLKERGVEHIVIAFPQIMVDSVLNMVELPNQIAKEIGWRTWAYIDELDYETYPEVGHPFAESFAKIGRSVTARTPEITRAALSGCVPKGSRPPWTFGQDRFTSSASGVGSSSRRRATSTKSSTLSPPMFVTTTVSAPAISGRNVLHVVVDALVLEADRVQEARFGLADAGRGVARPGAQGDRLADEAPHRLRRREMAHLQPMAVRAGSRQDGIAQRQGPDPDG